MDIWGSLRQISARALAESSARATAIVVRGGGEMIVVKEQGEWVDRPLHGPSILSFQTMGHDNAAARIN